MHHQTTRVQIGKTDGFRYFGIQPLPKDTDIDIHDVLPEGSFETQRDIRAGENGSLYLEIGVQGLTASDGSEVRRVADHIAERLQSEDRTVIVEPGIRTIGFGRHLF